MDTPKYLSNDHDPLFNFHHWKAKLRALDVEEIKNVTYVPLSNPFVEWLIGTIRHEYLENVFFWNVPYLVMKLEQFRDYYNNHRVHSSLGGDIPAEINNEALQFV